jgi:lipopolysaccharide transport system permease protein
MLAIYRPPLGASVLAFPVLLALQVLFTVGVALLLAVSTTFFRDTRHLLELALVFLFWLTPVVYPLSQVDERFRPVVRFSPLAPFIVGYQEMFFYGRWPETSTWVAATAYAAVALVAGTWTFLAVDEQLTERV